MTVDRELVTRKMVLIARDLEPLRAIHRKGADAFVASTLDQAVVERYLERSIGRMIDINYHLITRTGGAPPADDHASFHRLVDLKILDAEFAGRIARAAGLRNRIVHEYDDLDPARVFEALASALDDIPAYVARVSDWLNRRPEPAARP